MYQLIESSKDSDVLSICFHRSISAREDKFPNKNKLEEIIKFRTVQMIILVADHQESATYELGFKLTFKGYNDYILFSHRPLGGATVNDRRTANENTYGLIHISDAKWYVQHNTTNISTFLNEK